ncbi:MAG: hypothetical protein EPN50_08195, partial [Chloroflexota bacterium]
MFRPSGKRQRSGLAVMLASLALMFAALGGGSLVFAAGPGDNGLGTPNNGTKAAVTVGGSVTAAANSATMNAGAKMTCSTTDSVLGFTGSFTLNATVDSGSQFVLYLVNNNGSNASPAGNVADNY